MLYLYLNPNVIPVEYSPVPLASQQRQTGMIQNRLKPERSHSRKE